MIPKGDPELLWLVRKISTDPVAFLTWMQMVTTNVAGSELERMEYALSVQREIRKELEWRDAEQHGAIRP